jgi:glutaryl-CoA dehydrogenase
LGAEWNEAMDHEWTISDVAIVWAKANDEIKGFIVESKHAGFQAPEIKNKLSLRASVTSDLILDDVFVPMETCCRCRRIEIAADVSQSARYGIAWAGSAPQWRATTAR